MIYLKPTIDLVEQHVAALTQTGEIPSITEINIPEDPNGTCLELVVEGLAPGQTAVELDLGLYWYIDACEADYGACDGWMTYNGIATVEAGDLVKLDCEEMDYCNSCGPSILDYVWDGKSQRWIPNVSANVCMDVASVDGDSVPGLPLCFINDFAYPYNTNYAVFTFISNAYEILNITNQEGCGKFECDY